RKKRPCVPQQHYDNGVKKNDDTRRAYKAVVRILKNVRNHFVDHGLMKIEDMSSFFIESLVWNVPDSYFQGSTCRDDAVSVALKMGRYARPSKGEQLCGGE